MNKIEVVTENSILRESYYNCCRLADLTGYANPIGALATTHEVVWVEKDQYGNIVRLSK